MNLYQVQFNSGTGHQWIWADDIVQAAHRFAASEIPHHQLSHIRTYKGKRGRRELFRAYTPDFKRWSNFSVIQGE